MLNMGWNEVEPSNVHMPVYVYNNINIDSGAGAVGGGTRPPKVSLKAKVEPFQRLRFQEYPNRTILFYTYSVSVMCDFLLISLLLLHGGRR